MRVGYPRSPKGPVGPMWRFPGGQKLRAVAVGLSSRGVDEFDGAERWDKTIITPGLHHLHQGKVALARLGSTLPPYWGSTRFRGG